MKKALLLICAASILVGMCGCSKTIKNPLGINPDSRTTSSTTPVPQTVTPQTTADYRSNYCGNINANYKSGNNDRKARNLEHVNYRQVRNEKTVPCPCSVYPRWKSDQV